MKEIEAYNLQRQGFLVSPPMNTKMLVSKPGSFRWMRVVCSLVVQGELYLQAGRVARFSLHAQAHCIMLD